MFADVYERVDGYVQSSNSVENLFGLERRDRLPAEILDEIRAVPGVADADDTDMFFTNVFSFSHRKRLAEHAYQSTLRDLRMHRKTLKPLLARHGISLRDKVLDDPKRTLLGTLTDKPPRRSKVTSHLHRALDDLDRALSGEAPAKPRTSHKAPAARRPARAKAGV